jgi:hypothetical protein
MDLLKKELSNKIFAKKRTNIRKNEFWQAANA